MKVGIIGSGGREHALCHFIKKSKKVSKIYCFPGNAGTNQIAENIDINLNDFDQLKNNELFYQEIFIYVVIFGIIITFLKPKIAKYIKN